MVQVWWYHAGLCFGRLAVHNVATSETKPIAVSKQMPAVTVMAQVCCACSFAGEADVAHCQAFPAAGVASFWSASEGSGLPEPAWRESDHLLIEWGCRISMAMSGLATRMAMSDCGAKPHIIPCVHPLRLCTLTSGEALP